MSSKTPKRRKRKDGIGRNDQIGENGGNDQIGGNDPTDEIDGNDQIDRNENENDDNENVNESTAVRSQLKNTESKWQHLDQEQSAWASMTSDSG